MCASRNVCVWKTHCFAVAAVITLVPFGLSSSYGGSRSLSEVLRKIDDTERIYDARTRTCGPDSVRVLCDMVGAPCATEGFSRILGSEGVKVSDLIDVTRRDCQINLVAQRYADSNALPIPSILILDDSHCVVAVGRIHGELAIFDPAGRGSRLMSAVDKEDWDGAALVRHTGISSIQGIGVVSLAAMFGIMTGVYSKKRAV